MSTPAARRVSRRAGLVALVLAGLVSAGSAADEVPAREQEFRGACYCRAQGELTCTASLTARQCDLRSREALCDEWFWRERLACWNWGYGG